MTLILIFSASTTWHRGYNLPSSKTSSRGKKSPLNRRKRKTNKGLRHAWPEPRKRPVIPLPRRLDRAPPDKPIRRSTLRQKRIVENVPRTLDNSRENDPAILPSSKRPDGASSIQLDELNSDIASDPFARYFNFEDDPNVPPRVLITTSPKASKSTYDFCDELVGVFPGAEYIRRKKGKGFEVGRIAGWAAGRGYKHLLVVNEDMKKPSVCRPVHVSHVPLTTSSKMPSRSSTSQTDPSLISSSRQ